MKIYSVMSDKDINKLVASEFGCKEVAPDVFLSEERRYDFDKPKSKRENKFYFDPCNIAEQAWPIIVSNLIGIEPIYSCGALWLAHAGDDGEFRHTDKNPLRAAMIVFLKMQDDKSE